MADAGSGAIGKRRPLSRTGGEMAADEEPSVGARRACIERRTGITRAAGLLILMLMIFLVGLAVGALYGTDPLDRSTPEVGVSVTDGGAAPKRAPAPETPGTTDAKSSQSAGSAMPSGIAMSVVAPEKPNVLDAPQDDDPAMRPPHGASGAQQPKPTGSAADQPPPAAATQQPLPPTPAAGSPDRHEDAAEVSALIARGDALLGQGDVTSARLFYQRAADAGDGAAALRLGETFDPAFLAQAQLGRLSGDPAKARDWYRRARDLGNPAAETLLKRADEATRK